MNGPAASTTTALISHAWITGSNRLRVSTMPHGESDYISRCEQRRVKAIQDSTMDARTLRVQNRSHR
jgi:hypothetical protein